MTDNRKQEQFVEWLESVELYDELASYPQMKKLQSVWEAAGSPQAPEESTEREVKLEVFVHTNFEDTETLNETGQRILNQVTEDLQNGETSAGIDLVSITPL